MRRLATVALDVTASRLSREISSSVVVDIGRIMRAEDLRLLVHVAGLRKVKVELLPADPPVG